MPAQNVLGLRGFCQRSRIGQGHRACTGDLWHSQIYVPKCTQQKTPTALVLFLRTAQLNYSQDHTAKESSCFTAARKMPTRKKC